MIPKRESYHRADRMQPKLAIAGLCPNCEKARLIRTGHGSLFILCSRAEEDPSFPRYPRLPVVSCRGFEAKAETASQPVRSEGESNS
jgi:hypothetical protein